ncbi:hypothetical protein HPB48_002011 [Haemaphysalis longicornis]|uniref:Mab-21-like nucleotidyltransferase domain-containing protein n=1 Tax=Haemaphysalis longicornis TaxID=44386 RepID=A0A9J6FBS2_HAELO|nr:hypothetical protein HPB48_002011 [Haemaphysalis longicornis]
MYQKLRIFNPDEFDIDIVLFFPLPKGCASPETHQGTRFPALLKELILRALKYGDLLDYPHFAWVCVPCKGPRWGSVELTKAHLGYLKENLGVQAFHQLKKLVNEEGRVLVPRCLQWFQSVVDKARQRYKPPPSEDGADSFTVIVASVAPSVDVCKRRGRFKLKVSSADPAITLHVTLACGDKFDVDLVPVSEWDYTQLPEGLDLPEWAHKYCSKALKEKYKWNLSSYACKTVVMRHIVAKPRRSDWDHKHLFTRLLEVVGMAQHYISFSPLFYLSISLLSLSAYQEKRVAVKLYPSLDEANL